MKLIEFLRKYGDDQQVVQELRSKGLLRDGLRCEICGDSMSEQKDKNGDGFIFYCGKRTCRKKKSIRHGSFFQQSRLPLSKIMLFMHLWAKGYSEKLILDDFDFGSHTVVDWMRFCRDLCVYDFEEQQPVIGGPNTVVEIDETLLVRRKYNRGRLLTDGWLFGGIQRTNNGEFKAFMMLVYNRSEAHLTHIIREHVLPGTHIITDGWAAYRNLSSMGYSHSVIVHEENFIDPDDPSIHTQTIESTWCSLNRFLRSHGTNRNTFVLEYICEWLFRRRHSDVFDALLGVIRQKHPFN